MSEIKGIHEYLESIEKKLEENNQLEKARLKSHILEIKDPAERRREMLKHIDLFTEQ